MTNTVTLVGGAPANEGVAGGGDDAGRYEILVDGELAGFTQVRFAGNRAIFPHTEIDERFEGRGLASELIGSALDDVRARGLRVVALCPFVKAFIERHPDYQDLLAT